MARDQKVLPVEARGMPTWRGAGGASPGLAWTVECTHSASASDVPGRICPRSCIVECSTCTEDLSVRDVLS